MVKTIFSITAFIVGMVFTVVGAFLAYTFRTDLFWNNLFSDMFGAGVLVAAIGIILLITGGET